MRGQNKPPRHRRKLKTASCVMFFAVACSMRKNPHMKMLIPRYLAIGNLCIMKFVGTSKSECQFGHLNHTKDTILTKKKGYLQAQAKNPK